MCNLQESVTETRKDETSSIPKLLELNLEETHKTRGDAVEDAIKLREAETRNKTVGGKDGDRSQEAGPADSRRYDSSRNKGEIRRTDDRPPTKKMKDEPSSYRNQREDGCARDRTRGGRGRGKVDTYRGGASRGGRSSANDFRYPQNRENIVSKYQSYGGEKRGTLTFERSDLRDRQMSSENKREQFRFSDSGSRQSREDRNRENRGKDGREISTKKDKLPEGQSTSDTVVSSASGAFTSSSDREPVRTNAWSQPLHGSKQSSEPPQSDEVPDITQWTASSRPLLDSAASQQEGSTDKDASIQNLIGDLAHKAEIESRSAESQGNDKESGKQFGSRGESSRVDYRSDRGRRHSRRGRRQNWPDSAVGDENMPRYTRQPQQHANRDGRGPRVADDLNEEEDEEASREDHNQKDGRRTSRYGSGGRGVRQFGNREYSVRLRGRGMLRFHCLCRGSNIFILLIGLFVC